MELVLVGRETATIFYLVHPSIRKIWSLLFCSFNVKFHDQFETLIIQITTPVFFIGPEQVHAIHNQMTSKPMF